MDVSNTPFLNAVQPLNLSWLPYDFRFGDWETCFYCGELPNSTDHVIPWSMYSVEENHSGRSHGIRTPACSDCNHVLGSAYFATLQQRCYYIRRRLEERSRKVMRTGKWENGELKQLRGMLRKYVKNNLILKGVATHRIEWQFGLRFTELWEDALAQAKSQYPRNKRLHRFLAVPWTADKYQQLLLSWDVEPRVNESASPNWIASADAMRCSY